MTAHIPLASPIPNANSEARTVGTPGRRANSRNAKRTSDMSSTLRSNRALLRTVGARDVDRSLIAFTGDANPPGIAAHFAVLDEAAVHLRLDVDLRLFAAVRAGH